jgi:hypothetical protein
MNSTTITTQTPDHAPAAQRGTITLSRPTLRHWTRGGSKPKLISFGWVPVASTMT